MTATWALGKRYISERRQRLPSSLRDLLALAKMPVYRFHARHAFLTYPRCTMTKEAVLAQLKTKGDVQGYCISVEAHEDGTPHVHAYLRFAKKTDVRSATHFDINEAGRVFHGNYQAARKPSEVIEYIQKDGDFIEDCAVAAKKSWANILEESDSIIAFMDAIREHYARDYILQHERLLAFAAIKFRPTEQVYAADPTQQWGFVPQEMDNWVRDHLNGTHISRVCIFH